MSCNWKSTVNTEMFFVPKYKFYSSNKIRKKQNEHLIIHRLSKFDKSVVVNLKPILYLFGVYTTWFFIQKLLELLKTSFDG